MANFSYRARDKAGKAVSGEIFAADQDAVTARLHELGYIPVNVKPATQNYLLTLELPSLNKAKTEDYVMFANQLAAMIAAGIPLSAALNVLVDQTDNKGLRTALQKVAEDINAGASFAEALSKHRRVFSNLFVNMVAAGEAAGNLEDVLTRLAQYIEKQAEFQQKIVTALFYPAVLLFLSVIVVLFVSMTILPAFVKMFTEAGVPLPLPTQILYSTNLFIRNYWLFIILFLFGLYFLLKGFSKTKVGKAFIDKFILDLPIWGTLARKAEIARFARTLASLLSSGLPMLKSLETLERTTSNTVFATVVKGAYDKVSRGGSLYEQLKASGEFPAMPVKMVAVGEETGSLDKMLTKVAEFYEMQVDYSIKRLTSLLEPVFLIFVGGAVAFIVASIIIPIFSMISVIRR